MIDLEKYSDKTLKAYHDYMSECLFEVEKFEILAVGIWKEVLKELDKRGLVKLIQGSYNDINSAVIRKTW